MSSLQIHVLIAVAEILVKSSILLAAGLGVARLLRVRDASQSHAVLVMALTASLAVAIFSPVVPGMTILRLRGSAEGHVENRIPRYVAPATGDSISPIVQATTSNALDRGRSLTEGPRAWLVGLALLWGIGVAYVVGRTLWNLHRLALIRRFGADPSGSKISSLAASSAKTLGIRRSCEVLVSLTDLPEIPVTWGLIKPTILLPKGAEDWPQERLGSVLLHELAHVKRADAAWRLLSELVCAAFWFQPLAWKAAAQMRDDAETAADETVLRSDVKPSDYADTLLWMASTIGHSRKNHPYEGVPAMNPSRLETRLRLVLSDPSRERGSALIAGLAAAATVAALAPVLVAMHASQTNTPTDRKEQQKLAMLRAKELALATLLYGQDFDEHYPYVQSTQGAQFALKPYVATPDQLYPGAPKTWTPDAMTDYLGRPYLRLPDVFESPTPGGRFSFNLNLAGVVGSDIPKPAETPMWVENLPDKTQPFAVCFGDGHSRLIPPTSKMENTLDTPGGPVIQVDKAAIDKALTWKFRRHADSKPLPANYGEPIKP